MWKVPDLKGWRGCGKQLSAAGVTAEGKEREGNVEIIETATYAEAVYAGVL